MLLLSWVGEAQGWTDVHEGVSRHYFSPESAFWEDPHMCKPWISRGRRHRHRPGGSGWKSQKHTCGCSTWGGMCSQGHHRQICASGKAYSGVGWCSGRGCAVRGKHSRANAHDAGCLVVPSPSAFSMKYWLVQYLLSMSCVPTIRPLCATDIINFCGKKNLHYHGIKPMTCPAGTWNYRDNNHCTHFSLSLLFHL